MVAGAGGACRRGRGARRRRPGAYRRGARTLRRGRGPRPFRRGVRRSGGRHERRRSSPRSTSPPPTIAAEDGEALIIDLDGYEGPLHVLLALARSAEGRSAQALDPEAGRPVPGLRRTQAQRPHFSLAADYLVMAAWLAYLKSRLLLPKPEPSDGDEPPAEEMAAGSGLPPGQARRACARPPRPCRPAPSSAATSFARGDPEAIQMIRLDAVRGRSLQPDAGLCRPSAMRDAEPPLPPRLAQGLPAGGRPRRGCAACCRTCAPGRR